ncbi:MULTISPECIES: LysR substrate-binding domain-containing protein [Cupriavidus]
MEIKWLEDFVSLAETHSFSRSAEQRHVTQPAFSRRIQSLESWVGTELIDRSSYPTSLTAAGKVFYEQALAMLAQVSETRALMRGQRSANGHVLEFAVPHTLSLTFFPEWLKAVEREIGTLPCRLRALNVHDAVLALVDGGCDLVMVYHHARQAIQLDPAHYDMLVLGTERLSPYSVPDAAGKPLYRLPGTDKKPVPFLSYTPNAFLGRMVEMLLHETADKLKLDKCYETDMAEALKAMALAGHGMAFLPESAVREELARHRLVRAEPVRGAPLSIDMEIRLYREKPGEQASERRSAQQRNKRQLVERVWHSLAARRLPAPSPAGGSASAAA